MAQHDYDIANGTGAAVRTDINNVLDAVVSQNSGSSEPSTTFSYQYWADTTAGLLKIRNGANNAWVTVGTLDAANLGLATLASPALTGNPTAPTPASGDNDTSVATTAFVKTLVDSAVATAVGNLTDSQMPAGSVVQVINASWGGYQDTTSSDMVGSGLTASITPSSTSNKILVQFNVNCESYGTSTFSAVVVSVYRGAGLDTNLSGTNLAGNQLSDTAGFGYANAAIGSNASSDLMVSASHLDSPSSTSSVAYTVAFRRPDSSGSARLGGRGVYSTMTLMEIKG
tara:strand:- start:910 stop:1764 length:855 start_codon:yes stop_codon:yes gene_type:complete